ncbi:MAG: SDR family NAD(P)-dependent oxidoreductase [Polaromonas sp.]|uniref:SDR family NAD(P)-dependent oxidoreductase n=1 Tax=Polaromonas sp. TaxID=1869339 RepID=UPI0017E39BE5|nr:SDR family NAD(P)-dependent oxidoreductase [Polaromonas sp.]NMM10880.1 SDR family NAD(P)-dependent oxidoreductase [Polaromonas sp.]
MTQHLTLLTGASRGMGLAIARQLLSQGHTVLCISRSVSDALAQHAERAGSTVLQWTHDLAEGAALSVRLENWLNEQGDDAWTSATLINNAGVIPRIGPLSEADAADLARTLRVGLEAPMQLTAVFLRATESWRAERKVLNISSGLGRRAMASQAAYCAVKAGIDHFTRCLALDEAQKSTGAKVCSLAPGVIDTDMQAQLRGADGSAFPDRDNFLQLKSGGQLTSPEEAARRVLSYLARPDFGSHPVADIRD